MAFTIIHHKRDGSVERKRVRLESGLTPAQAERVMARTHKEKMKRLRDRKGWSKDRKHKLVASIPNAVYEDVLINDGPEAARDIKHLERIAREKWGIDVRAKR